MSISISPRKHAIWYPHFWILWSRFSNFNKLGRDRRNGSGNQAQYLEGAMSVTPIQCMRKTTPHTVHTGASPLMVDTNLNPLISAFLWEGPKKYVLINLVP